MRRLALAITFMVGQVMAHRPQPMWCSAAHPHQLHEAARDHAAYVVGLVERNRLLLRELERLQRLVTTASTLAACNQLPVSLTPPPHPVDWDRTPSSQSNEEPARFESETLMPAPSLPTSTRPEESLPVADGSRPLDAVPKDESHSSQGDEQATTESSAGGGLDGNTFVLILLMCAFPAAAVIGVFLLYKQQ